MSNEKTYFYIDKIDIFDPYDENMIRRELADKHKNMSEEEIEAYISGQQSLCREGKAIPLMYYETEDGRQLNFHTKKHLDSTPEDTSRGTGIFFGGSSEDSLNGRRLRICHFEPVDKDYAGEFDIELFSCHIHRESYTVKF